MSEFKVGDRVRVVRQSSGYGINWVGSMNKYLSEGQIYTVSSSETDRRCVKLFNASPWSFPWSSLEHVEQKFIDGIAISADEFSRRTAAPVEMTLEEIQKELGKFIKIK